MTKHKKSSADNSCGMVTAPWIYISDPSSDFIHARELATLIPDVLHVSLSRTADSPKGLVTSNKLHSKAVALVSDQKDDSDNCLKVKNANTLKEGAIKRGCNFVTVNIMDDLAKTSAIDKFGTNHLNIAAGKDVAEKIYKWLFTILTVRETLHLIPDEQMKKIDDKLFPDYVYCPVNEFLFRPKDVKIQFVALVLSKPQISEGQKLTWQVADKTGVANFYFNHRGESSQYTWDWVLALRPGDRKALPRMPMVEIKEKKRVTLVKAPFRLTAAALTGTGHVVKGVGKGLQKVGRAIKMGPSSEWIPEADVDAHGKKINWDALERKGDVKVVPATEKKVIDVFTEKGQRAWSDKDSLAGTEAGSQYDEKCSKEFV